MAVFFVMNPTLPAQIRVDPSIGASMAVLGERGAELAKGFAPVGETGNLKNSIRSDLVAGNVARISVNVPYWNFPEYGTSDPDYPTTPYLRPALSALGLKLT